MSILKNLAASLFVIAASVSCSTTIERAEIKFNNDFSGTAKATIISTSKSEIEEVHKSSNACDIDLREIYGYDKKFTAEYKFDSYEKLKNEPECSKVTNESVSFEPLKIKDGILTKDVTFKMKFKDLEYMEFIEELTIFIPGKVQDVDGVSSRYYDEDSVANSTKVSFSLRKAFKTLKEKAKGCDSYGKNEELDCVKRVASSENYALGFEDGKFSGLTLTITTQINKIKEFIDKVAR